MKSRAMKLVAFGVLLSATSVHGQAQPQPRLWLDAADVIVAPEASRTIEFRVEELPKDAKPVLWIAPRISDYREAGHWGVLAIDINGTPLSADRLIADSKTYRVPCYTNWPLRDAQKYAESDEGIHRWTVRGDDNLIAGENGFFGVPRLSATEGLEPTLAIDVTGLVKKGTNRIVLANHISKTRRMPDDVALPPNPDVPWFHLHARFVRVGLIGMEEIAAYNQAHSRPFGWRTRSFDVLDPKGFAAMQRYYGEAAERAATPEQRSFLRYVRAHYELWKGNYATAEELLAKGLSEAPEADWADGTLWLTGLAQARQGATQDAETTWKILRKRFPASSWSEVSQRESAIISWAGKPAPVNWPALEVGRAKRPPRLDGKLNDRVWRRAPVASDFVIYMDVYKRAPLRTEARALYDDQYFYLSVVCYEPVMDEIKNPHLERDTGVWNDDCIEFFVDPGRTYCQMYEFETGVEGGIVDCLNVWEVSFLQYNPERIDKVAKYADRWVLEMAIPWKAFGREAPKAGDVWLGNVVRNRPETDNRPKGAFVLGPAVWRYAAHDTQAHLIFR